MTAKQYIHFHGWQCDCDPILCRYMNVLVIFSNDGTMDETEMRIRAYDVDELSALFSDFCRENGYRQNTVCNIVIAGMMEGR